MAQGGERSGPAAVIADGSGPVRVTLGTPAPALPAWDGFNGFSGLSGFAAGEGLVFAQPPPAPEVSAAAHADGVELSWTLANDGGAALSGWQYRLSADGGETWTPDWTAVDGGAAAVGQTVAGLRTGTEYVFEVRARNGEGAGRAGRVAATPRALQPLAEIGERFWVRNRAVSEVLPAGDGGRPPYRYALTGTLPAGLRFVAAERRLTGTPTAATAARVLTYRVTDAAGAEVRRGFRVTVLAQANRPPVGQNAAGNQVSAGASIGRYEIPADGDWS